MQINLVDNSLKGEIHMAKVEYAPQGVCARLMKFEVEDGKLQIGRASCRERVFLDV